MLKSIDFMEFGGQPSYEKLRVRLDYHFDIAILE